MKDGKIDINTIIGFLLIGGIIFYFGYVNQPEVPVEDVVNKSEQVDTSSQADDVDTEKSITIADTTLAPEVSDSLKALNLGMFGLAADVSAEEELVTIENEVLELSISSKGGQIVKARLKDYQSWDSIPLHLIDDNNAAFNLNIEGDKAYNTNNLNFNITEKTANSVVMQLQTLTGEYLEFHYALQPNNYMLDWDIVSRDFGKYISAESALTWEMQTIRHEKNVETERAKTTLEYKFAGDDKLDDLSATSADNEEESNISWVAYRQQFFSSILWNKNGKFDKAGFVSQPLETEDHIKVMASKLSLNKQAGDLNMALGMYFGPNKYDVLKEYDQDFDELIPLGWGIFGWINRGIVINIFTWLEAYGLNYGLIILIIALFIKLILFPLTYSSYKSMAKMRVLKPEIDEINEQYKDKDPMKKQQATMQLYQKAGVNPLGGCIPTLLQFPVLISLFHFFPGSIELRQQSFLWASDLSTYDSIYNLPFTIPFYGDHVSLFTLLMTVSTLIYTYMNQQLTGQNQQYPQMKYIVYLMPIVFLGVFNNYAAGLSYYYFLANMITFGQQFAIKSYISEEKLLAKIEEKKQKPKKENRFMRRMQELQEKQEQQSRQSRRKNK